MASNPILPVTTTPGTLTPPRSGQTAQSEQSFGSLLKEAIVQMSQAQHEADALVEQVAKGRSGDLAGTMIALEKAQLSFQLMIQVRNKIVEAYQEIMRMPV